MSDIASALRDEIRRLARKAVRAEAEPLQRAASRYRAEIASLKREIVELQRRLRGLSKPNRTVAAPEPGAKHRWSPAKFAKHRARLGLSQEEMGKILGVSGQAIWQWEASRARPRNAQLMHRISQLRHLGKREARAWLEQQPA